MPILLPEFITDLEQYMTAKATQWATPPSESRYFTPVQEQEREVKIVEYASYLCREGLCLSVALAIAKEIDRRSRR